LPISLGLGDSLLPSVTMAGPLAASTAGGIVGSLAGAFVLLPALGLGGGLLLLAAALLALAAALTSRHAPRFVTASAAAGLGAAPVSVALGADRPRAPLARRPDRDGARHRGRARPSPAAHQRPVLARRRRRPLPRAPRRPPAGPPPSRSATPAAPRRRHGRHA